MRFCLLLKSKPCTECIHRIENVTNKSVSEEKQNIPFIFSTLFPRVLQFLVNLTKRTFAPLLLPYLYISSSLLYSFSNSLFIVALLFVSTIEKPLLNNLPKYSKLNSFITLSLISLIIYCKLRVKLSKYLNTMPWNI
jgi:hypothetical protein